MENGESALELLEAQAQIWNQAHIFINSELLFSAVELGIPDIIHNYNQPMPLPQLVESLKINPKKSNCVYRMMRVLTNSGFFIAENTDGNKEKVSYKLTPASRLLLKDNPYGMSPVFTSMISPVWINSWRSLGRWLKNDDATSFETANGGTVFDYVSKEPAMNEIFNQCLASEALVTATALIEKKREVFEGLRSLVDVGGGNGSMMKAISGEFPNLEKIVLDLPHVVDDLKGSKNLSFVGGDMFEAIPPADAMLLKCVLHDWNDQDCVKILKCKKSIPSKEEGGRVLIIDIVMGDQNEDRKKTETQMLWDMAMMAYFTSRERSEKEWAKLFSDSGFSGYKIHSILGVRSLIEVFP